MGVNKKKKKKRHINETTALPGLNPSWLCSALGIMIDSFNEALQLCLGGPGLLPTSDSSHFLTSLLCVVNMLPLWGLWNMLFLSHFRAFAHAGPSARHALFITFSFASLIPPHIVDNGSSLHHLLKVSLMPHKAVLHSVLFLQSARNSLSSRIHLWNHLFNDCLSS